MLVTDALIAGRLVRPFALEQKEEWGYTRPCRGHAGNAAGPIRSNNG